MAFQRLILPAPGRTGEGRSSPAFTPPPKRQQTAVACEQCRKRKIKCDGTRPSCNNCSKKVTPCEYAADPGTGRAGRSVARQEALERDKEVLQMQLQQWQQLISYVRSRPESEAVPIFQQLRHSHDDDPASILQMVQTGGAFAQIQQSPASRFEQIDREAWAFSPIQIEARPWTSIAGNGIVSELLSLFFEWEATFDCPMIETSAFLSDLRSQDVQSLYCSPMLVNAICALSCFLCDRIQELDNGHRGSFAKKFLVAAERAFEENDKPSLTSVQALYLMFMYGVATGQDKKYAKYRFTVCSMIQTLNLEKKYASTAGALQSQQMESQTNQDPRGLKARAISRGTWGLFCTESIVALAYGQPSLISRPTIPQPQQEILLQVQCELSTLLNEIMDYQLRVVSDVGDSDDLARRADFDARLKAQIQRLTPEYERDSASASSLHSLMEFYHLSTIVLLRPLLECDTLPPIVDLGPPKRVCINSCEDIVAGWTRLEQSNGSKIPSLWQVLTTATCCFMLVTQLGKLADERLPTLFIKCCAMLRQQTAQWPLAVYWLQALRYFARTIDATEHIPIEALQYLDGLEDLGVDISGEVSIGFIVPMQEELAELASDSDAPEVSIGKLIEKFQAATMSL